MTLPLDGCTNQTITQAWTGPPRQASAQVKECETPQVSCVADPADGVEACVNAPCGSVDRD